MFNSLCAGISVFDILDRSVLLLFMLLCTAHSFISIVSLLFCVTSALSVGLFFGNASFHYCLIAGLVYINVLCDVF